MKLADVILLSLAAVFIIIGIYEIMATTPANGYWAVMLSLIFFFWYFIRKNRN